MVLRITLSPTDEYGGGAFNLEFEHSLATLSKWESYYGKPFFGREEKTPEQSVKYFELMLLTKNPPENFIDRLTVDDFQTLNEYINAPHTATTFREEPNQRPNNSVITSEQFYSWMIDFKIPWEAQHWEFNRLLTLIRVRGVSQTKQKPMSKNDQREQMARLNAERRKQLGSNG